MSSNNTKITNEYSILGKYHLSLSPFAGSPNFTLAKNGCRCFSCLKQLNSIYSIFLAAGWIKAFNFFP